MQRSTVGQSLAVYYERYKEPTSIAVEGIRVPLVMSDLRKSLLGSDLAVNVVNMSSLVGARPELHDVRVLDGNAGGA